MATRGADYTILVFPVGGLHNFVVKSANIRIFQPAIGAVVKRVPRARSGASSMLVCVRYVDFFRIIRTHITIVVLFCSMLTYVKLPLV